MNLRNVFAYALFTSGALAFAYGCLNYTPDPRAGTPVATSLSISESTERNNLFWFGLGALSIAGTLLVQRRTI